MKLSIVLSTYNEMCIRDRTEALQLDMQLMQMFFFYQADGKDFQFLYLNPCI